MKVSRRDFCMGAAVATGGLAANMVSARSVVGSVWADPRLLEVARAQVARLRSALTQVDVVAIGDFSLHSSESRFHLIRLSDGESLSLRVAHGMASDPDNDGWLSHFSNMAGSSATSRGGYVTEGFVQGQFGRSISLRGLDPANSNAQDRSLVVHAAEYCSGDHVARWGKAGRSDGSLALSPADMPDVFGRLTKGHLIYLDCLNLD